MTKKNELQRTLQSTIPPFSWTAFWLIALLLSIILVITSVAYLSIKGRSYGAPTGQASLQGLMEREVQLTDELQLCQNACKTHAPPLPSTVDEIIKLMTSSTAPALDGRKLVTYEEIYHFDRNPLFLYEWNSATATQTRTVKAQDIGIQFDAPYNSNWGNSYFAVTPSEQDDPPPNIYPITHRFGFVRFVEGKDPMVLRQYKLENLSLEAPYTGDQIGEGNLPSFITERYRGGVKTDPENEKITLTQQRIHGLFVIRVDLVVDCKHDQFVSACGNFVEYYVLGSKGIGVFSIDDHFRDNQNEFQKIIQSIRPL